MTKRGPAQVASVSLDWRELVGGDTLRPGLERLIAQGELSQCLLLIGRDGIGKRRLAREIAARHFCPTACGECGSCRKIISDTHPDVMVVTGEDGAIKVEAAEALQQHLALTPRQAGATARRLALIDGVEELTRPATNRLLKLFEEPPPSAGVVMTTARPLHLLPTLRSRACKLHVAPPPVASAVACLQREAVKRGWSARHDWAELLRQHQLSPGLVLAHLEQAAKPGPQWSERLLDSSKAWNVDFKALAGSASAAEWIERWERGLNTLYRAGGVGHNKMAYRRDLLQKMKAVACQAGVPLNVQLALEALTTAVSCEWSP